MANDYSMEVQGVGWFDLLFLTQYDLFVLTLDRVLFVKGLVDCMNRAPTASNADSERYFSRTHKGYQVNRYV